MIFAGEFPRAWPKPTADLGIPLGSDTVACVATVGTFHILSDKRVHAALVHELDEAWEDKDGVFGWEDLEKLPYLVRRSSCVHHAVTANILYSVDGRDQGVSSNIPWHSLSSAESCGTRVS